MVLPMTDITHEDGKARQLKTASVEELADPDEWPNRRFLGAFLDWKYDPTMDGGGNTYRNYRSKLRRFHSWLDREELHISEVTNVALKDYLEEMSGKGGYSPTTVDNEYDSLHHLYHSLQVGADSHQNDDPVLGVFRYENVDCFEDPRILSKSEVSGLDDKTMTETKQGTPRYSVSLEEKEAMLDNVPEPRTRNKLIIQLLWETGFRRQTLANATCGPNGELDREDQRITAYSPKAKKKVTASYSDAVARLLSVYLDLGVRDGNVPAETSDRLFLGYQHPMEGDGINQVVKKAADRAGVQEVVGTDADGRTRYAVTAHTLRHGHACYLLDSGVPINVVKKSLGHHDIQLTQIYTEMNDEDFHRRMRDEGMASRTDAL